MASFTQKQKKLIAKNIGKSIDKLGINDDGVHHLAHELDVSPATVSQWVHGKRTPRLEHLYRMSKIFNLSLQQLCGLPKPTSKRTSELASDIIIKIASCKNKTGKALFHNISPDKMPPAIGLIFTELHQVLQYQRNISDT